MLPIVLLALASAGQYDAAPPPPTVVACRDGACPAPAQYPGAYQAPYPMPQAPPKSPPLGIPPAPPKSPPLGIPPVATPQYGPPLGAPPVATPQYGYGPAPDAPQAGGGIFGGGSKLNGKKILFKRNQGLGRLGASGTVEANSRKKIVFKNNTF